VATYVGKAAALGTGTKNYKGFQGRADGYVVVPDKATPHLRTLSNSRNLWKLRVLCQFEDTYPLEKMLLFEDIMTVCLRAFGDDGTYNFRRMSESYRLIKR
jgi:hypothetical protein